jgi:hypothetical protein
VIICLSTVQSVLNLSSREDGWDRRGDLMNSFVVTVVQYVKVSRFSSSSLIRINKICWNNDNRCEHHRPLVFQMCFSDNIRISTVVHRIIAYLQSSAVNVFVNCDGTLYDS